jgi:hypothetical protein
MPEKLLDPAQAKGNVISKKVLSTSAQRDRTKEASGGSLSKNNSQTSKEKSKKEEDREDISHLGKSKGFLGAEFLTWLWYLIEQNSEQLIIPLNATSPVSVSLWIDDRVVISAVSGQHNTLRGGDPANSAEAAVALITGKSIREIKLGMNIHGVGEYRVTLNAVDLRPRGLVLPTPSDIDDDEKIHISIPMRIKQLELFLRVFDGIFLKFMDERILPKWEKSTIHGIKEWVSNRSNWTTIH